MREEIWAGATLDLVAASFLWNRYPRLARQLVEGATRAMVLISLGE